MESYKIDDTDQVQLFYIEMTNTVVRIHSATLESIKTYSIGIEGWIHSRRLTKCDIVDGRLSIEFDVKMDCLVETALFRVHKDIPLSLVTFESYDLLERYPLPLFKRA